MAHPSPDITPTRLALATAVSRPGVAKAGVPVTRPPLGPLRFRKRKLTKDEITRLARRKAHLHRQTGFTVRRSGLAERIDAYMFWTRVRVGNRPRREGVEELVGALLVGVSMMLMSLDSVPIF